MFKPTHGLIPHLAVIRFHRDEMKRTMRGVWALSNTNRRRPEGEKQRKNDGNQKLRRGWSFPKAQELRIGEHGLRVSCTTVLRREQEKGLNFSLPSFSAFPPALEKYSNSE